MLQWGPGWLWLAEYLHTRQSSYEGSTVRPVSNHITQGMPIDLPTLPLKHDYCIINGVKVRFWTWVQTELLRTGSQVQFKVQDLSWTEPQVQFWVLFADEIEEPFWTGLNPFKPHT